MKKIVNLLGYGLFYSIAISIESIAPFILAPMLTHYLPVYDYGIWAIFQGATAFLYPLLGMTFDDYVRMQYYRQPREVTVGYLFSIILISIVSACTLGIISVIFNAPLGQLLEFPGGWLWSIILCAWLYAMFYILLSFYQFDEKRIRFAIIHFVQAIITLLASIFMVMTGWGWHGAVLGKIIGLSCGSALAFFWIALHFPKAAGKYIQPRHVLELLSFGLRYIGNGIVLVVVVFTNRLMLAHLLGIQAASLFSVASLFPVILVIAIQGFIYGWQPWCFSRLTRRDPADVTPLALGAGFYFAALPVGASLLAWISCWLGPYVIDKQYAQAFTLVPLLMMAMVAQGYYRFSQSILHYYQKLGTLSNIAMATMSINLALDYLLIPRLGMAGAAWATCLAYGTAFLITAIMGSLQLRRHYLKDMKGT